LRERGIRLVGELTGLSRKASEKIFIAARGHVKTAVVMALKKIELSAASELIRQNKGFLHLCLKK
jgi:N-acetylmuramic acid 6-phosphate (MurNAc-6-P) etherase